MIGRTTIFAVVFLIAVPGCRKESMGPDVKPRPLAGNEFFANGQLSRPLPEGVVPRQNIRDTHPVYATSDAAGRPLGTFPWRMTADDIHRGQERYTIYCVVCHGDLGYADGMIVQRGLTRPPTFHIARLVADPVTGQFPAGHYIDVITKGYGAMYSYATRVSPDDRWRIAAYIRVLQIRQQGQDIRNTHLSIQGWVDLLDWPAIKGPPRLDDTGAPR